MTHPTTSSLLTAITFTPALGALAVLLSCLAQPLLGWSRQRLEEICRGVALVAAAIPALLAIWLWWAFDGARSGFQFVQDIKWIDSFNIHYFVGVDGVSVAMVILTALIGLVAVVASMPWWVPDGPESEQHFSRRMVPGYLCMLLLLETASFGVFVALDLFLFYVFWEMMLLPMYFLIGIWGGKRKEYAAIKFFLYTLSGSVLMLLGAIGLYHFGPVEVINGVRMHTFDMTAMARWSSHYLSAPAIFGWPFTRAVWVVFFVAFAIKVPMFPLHTWLPDAHVEAPTPVSVVLAAVLLKMGAYGMLRINFGILPDATRWADAAIAVFGCINIVYGALVCLAQRDLKRLIAYSSISHMGFVLLGMAALTPQGIDGAVLQMWNHGIISAMLFLAVGVIYDRAHHREIDGFGGIAARVPEYAGLTGLAFFASLGLPGLCGFISEFLVFSGSFSAFQWLTLASLTSVIITAAYYLWTWQRIFFGQLNERYRELADINWRERLCLYPLAGLALFLGFYPQAILRLIQGSLGALLRTLHG